VGTAASGAANPVVLNGGVTDARGNAYAVYTPGANLPTEDLQDTIQASVTGATAAIIITRSGTASASTVPSGYIITMTPEKTSLKTGERSILTAIVKDGSGNLVSGLLVSFETVFIPSGATITAVNGTTDASGKATAIFTAGSLTPTLEVQDTVKASVNSGGYYAASAAIITRVASTAVPQAGYMLTLTAEKTSLKAGKSSILTATVEDASGNLVSGLTVTFSFPGGSASGATLSDIDAGTSGLTTATGVTDANGRAIAVFTAGSALPTSELQDTVSASVTDGTYTAADAIISTREASTATAPKGLTITVSANLTSLNAGKQSIITAMVENSDGSPASGLTVNFTTDPNPSGGGISTLINGVTDASGKAVAIYTAGSTLSTTTEVEDVVQASVTDGTYTAVDGIIITRLMSSATPTGVVMTLSATPVSLHAGQISIIKAQVNNADGSPASGLPVTFATAPNPSGASDPFPTSVNTDANGVAIAVYTAGNDTPSLSVDDAVTAQVTGASAAVIITRLPEVGTGNRLAHLYLQTDSHPSKEEYTMNIGFSDGLCVMTAIVTTDDGVTPVVGIDVTFGIVIGDGSISTVIDPIVTVSYPDTITVTTGDNGEAVAVFAGPGGGVAGQTAVSAYITGTNNSGAAAGLLTWGDDAP